MKAAGAQLVWAPAVAATDLAKIGIVAVGLDHRAANAAVVVAVIARQEAAAGAEEGGRRGRDQDRGRGRRGGGAGRAVAATEVAGVGEIVISDHQARRSRGVRRCRSRIRF